MRLSGASCTRRSTVSRTHGRFNVAITRAKELLIIVGNANLLKVSGIYRGSGLGRSLQSDPYWNGLLQIALRNNLYVGPDVGIPMTDEYQSRIEWVLTRRSR